MKAAKNLVTVTIFAVLSILSSFFNAGCGNENVIGTNVSNNQTAGDVADSITINVTKVYGGYQFDLTNRTRGTIINDFHVQFADTTVKITEWSLMWQFDPNTTDLNHGKIGEKAAPGQPPVQPGQTRTVLW
ncbi:MAG TPA: hypothetical protein VGK25_12885, partial [Ignavibacteria bacterium]